MELPDLVDDGNFDNALIRSADTQGKLKRLRGETESDINCLRIVLQSSPSLLRYAGALAN
ncbi:hypothetical protein F441_21459 [Phytophthora nicotianae CJ01A1]|uniref:Uncharacterized protein n=2 Tax=Phytophthora nicotianae TaxID=4792 RepID=W2VSW4_PHYNI|nr:hypothetical protein F444_21592 [Phytophthora nicotianae P1976]ETP01271.1 hypothetical protein F441_21459 [Phytophthora nicotianae CJ01A1]